MELGWCLTKNYEDMDDAEWMRHGDHLSIKIIRELCGLPPLSAKSVKCTNPHCGKVFFTQTIAGRRVEFFCLSCRKRAKEVDHPLVPDTLQVSDFSDWH